jgi:hypothetical protein
VFSFAGRFKVICDIGPRFSYKTVSYSITPSS